MLSSSEIVTHCEGNKDPCIYVLAVVCTLILVRYLITWHGGLKYAGCENGYVPSMLSSSEIVIHCEGNKGPCIYVLAVVCTLILVRYLIT
jgi:hypothetical protein